MKTPAGSLGRLREGGSGSEGSVLPQLNPKINFFLDLCSGKTLVPVSMAELGKKYGKKINHSGVQAGIERRFQGRENPALGVPASPAGKKREKNLKSALQGESPLLNSRWSSPKMHIFVRECCDVSQPGRIC